MFGRPKVLAEELRGRTEPGRPLHPKAVKSLKKREKRAAKRQP